MTRNLLGLMLLVMGLTMPGSARGETETISLNNTSGSSSPISYSSTGSTSGQGTKYLTLSSSKTLTISCSDGYTITKISFTGHKSTKSGTVYYSISTSTGSVNTGTLSDVTSSTTPNSTWSGSATSIIFTSSKSNAGAESMEVTYSATSTKTATTTTFPAESYTAYIGESFTSPTATVKAGDTSVSGASVTYSSSATSVATVDASTGAITLVGTGTATITATYAGDDTYGSSSAEYTLTVGKVYASLAALVADGTPTTDGIPVKVTLSDEVIQSIYTSTSAGKIGVYLKSGDQDVEIYCNGTTVPDTWEANGTVSGTLTGTWKLFKASSTLSVWEICPEDWTQLTYTAASTETFTINYSVNGSIVSTQEDVAAGTALSFPEVSSIGGKVFRGWVTTSTVSATEEPTYVTTSGLTATENITYYAVFATFSDGTTETVVFDATGLSTGTYTEGTKTDSGNNEWSYYASINKYSNTLYYALNSNASNYNIGSPEFSGNITAISLKAYNGSSTADRKLYICSSNSTAQPTSGDIAEITVSKAEKLSTTYTADLSSAGNFNQFYIYASASLGVSEVSVTYSTASYSDFCTIVTTKQTPTITVDDLVMYVGETMTVTATTDPTGLDLSYTVTEGTDAISLSSANVLSADGVGTGTVNAAFAGNTQYYASDASFGVIVKARYDLTEDEKNVKVLGPRVTDDIVTTGAQKFYGSTWNANTLVYVEDDNTYTNSNSKTNVVLKGTDGTYTCASLVLTDKVDVSIPIAFTATSATYTRDNTDKYGVLFFPYAPIKKDGYAYLQLTSKKLNTENQTGTLTFTEIEGDPQPNTPYLYRNTTGEKFNLSTTNASVVVAAHEYPTPNVYTVASNIEGWSIVNTYEKTYVFAEENGGDYSSVYSSITNNKVVDPNSYYVKGAQSKFAKINGYFSSSSFRSYFSVESGYEAKGFTFSLVVDDTTPTNIIDVEDNGDGTVKVIYDLSGRKLNEAQKGQVNIINGKKVFVK